MKNKEQVQKMINQLNSKRQAFANVGDQKTLHEINISINLLKWVLEDNKVMLNKKKTNK